MYIVLQLLSLSLSPSLSHTHTHKSDYRYFLLVEMDLVEMYEGQF